MFFGSCVDESLLLDCLALTINGVNWNLIEIPYGLGFSMLPSTVTELLFVRVPRVTLIDRHSMNSPHVK